MPLILHGILTPNRKQLALGVCEEVSSGTWDNNNKKKNLQCSSPWYETEQLFACSFCTASHTLKSSVLYR